MHRDMAGRAPGSAAAAEHEYARMKKKCEEFESFKTDAKKKVAVGRKMVESLKTSTDQLKKQIKELEKREGLYLQALACQLPSGSYIVKAGGGYDLRVRIVQEDEREIQCLLPNSNMFLHVRKEQELDSDIGEGDTLSGDERTVMLQKYVAAFGAKIPVYSSEATAGRDRKVRSRLPRTDVVSLRAPSPSPAAPSPPPSPACTPPAPPCA